MNDEQASKRVVLNEENLYLHSSIEELILQDHSCKGREWRVLDLSFIAKLRVLQVGDDCFEFVEEVKLIGLNQLERVVIGRRCFTTCYYERPRPLNPNGHFYLKNCERLRELRIGYRFSFSDYSVCVIENVPSLEVIEMGDFDERSYSFYHASLELKSDIDGMK